MPQTIQQKRAAFALEGVQQKAEELQGKEKDKERYKSYASAFPFMIHANGLGQAAAFYKSKSTGTGEGTQIYAALYELLSGWLISEGQPYHGCADLLSGITSRNMKTYIAAQAEAMAFMTWVKQFAGAFMEG